jgi:glycosyltransferase involved in cell wall biosynthesis
VIDVSVLTPSFGYGRFISDCVDSVIGQDGIEAEHLVEDGASQDETVDLLTSYGDRVTWTSEPDQGQSDALNKALAKAAGRWVAWLNADEYYLPSSLQALIETGDRHGADVVYGDSVTVDREGRVLGLRPEHAFSPSILRLYGPFPASVSMIVRREALGTAPWDRLLKVVMDWDLYLGLLAKGASFHHVEYPVGAFRRHEGQMSARPGSPETTVVRQRYGIPTGKLYRRIGTAHHRARKLAGGAYVRQIRGKPFRGRDLRWFRDDVGTDSFRELLEACYGDFASGNRLRESR